MTSGESWGKLRLLKLPALQKFFRSRYAWAAPAGLTLAAAFPKLGLAGLAWIAPGFILMTALGSRGGEAFRIGYMAGVVHYLTSLYWLLFIPFPIGAMAGWLALSAYLAVYPALWVWVCWRLFPVPFDPAHSAGHPRQWIEQFRSTPFWPRTLWTLLCAAAWVALEMIVAHALTGFPWNLLGASQYQILPLIQIASVTGVYGISFLVVWFSVSLAGFILGAVLDPKSAKLSYGDLTLPLVAVSAVAAFGVRQIQNPAGASRSLKVALVQPSIPQTLIWDPKENTNRFRQLLRLSEQALAGQPELLIWPEAAVPNMLRHDPETFEAVRRLSTNHSAWLILGADDAAPRPGSTREGEYNFYNSSFLISPAGQIEAAYRKQRLVIFGEYVPLARWLPFLKYLTPIGDGFTAGDRPVPFRFREPPVNASVLICFEDTFPHLARSYVEPDTDFLINLTNDGWFGESAAQWQHAANAVFRAVENGLPLVRCANNGLTCWIDARGGMHEVYFPGSPNLYQAGFKTASVPLQAPGERREPTFYGRHGDWFGWSCFGFVLGLLAVQQIALRRSR